MSRLEKTSAALHASKRLLPLALVLASALTAHGEIPLVSEDPGTQGRGGLQIEAGTEYGMDREYETGVDVKARSLQQSFVLTLGLSQPLDAFVEAPLRWEHVRELGETTSREHGVTDLALGLKWRFLERAGWEFALKPALSLPTGREEHGLGAGRLGCGTTLIASTTRGPWTALLNGAYILNENRLDERRHIWRASAAAAFQALERLRLVADFGVERDADRASHKDPAFALSGFIFSPNEDLDLALGVRTGLNAPETDLTVIGGVTLRFGSKG